LRFLQLQVKTLERRVGGTFAPVDALRVDGDLHVPFEEAVPHEYDMVLSVSALGAEELVPGAVAGGEEVDPLYDASGRLVGRVRRQRWPITFVVQLRADDLGNDLPVRRLRVRTVNTYASCVAGAPRSVALRHAMLSTHTLLALTEGAFVSLLDPPSWAAEPVRSCRNRHTFPVLMGSAEDCDLMLSAPILLYDHVQVAPESAGDLHDATEIDEILSLRTLTLTDAEKAEARATDARAAAIVDRVDAMTPADWGRLHGTIRTETAAPGAAPWWDPGSDTSVSPETDRVVVGGVPVRKGSRVRLHPRPRGTDVHDMFLDGRTAYVEAVLIDVDDTRHLAVTVDDDPAAELNRWYGRFRYFSADEVEPLMDSEGRQP
jgi:hypothetical protein